MRLTPSTRYTQVNYLQPPKQILYTRSRHGPRQSSAQPHDPNIHSSNPPPQNSPSRCGYKIFTTPLPRKSNPQIALHNTRKGLSQAKLIEQLVEAVNNTTLELTRLKRSFDTSVHAELQDRCCRSFFVWRRGECEKLGGKLGS